MAVGFRETSIDIIELPSNIPNGMPYVIDDCSLAHHLGFKNKTMWHFLHNTAAQYTVIEIPKRNKGKRIIHAPSPGMKLLLQRINERFLTPMHNRLGPHVTAYRTGLSVKAAVLQHIPSCSICETATKGVIPKAHSCPKRGLFLKLDLQNFFHTTTRAWIRNYFKRLGYSHTVASLLAGLLVVQDVLGQDSKMYTRTPQGSPASGAICNLVADQRLDGKILAYVKHLNYRYGLTDDWSWKYTRYSDDLAFTCGINPSKCERETIIKDIENIIVEAGYHVNQKKTRITHGYHRKDLLGIVFSEKPNYARDEYMKLRAIIHNCVTHGFDQQLTKAKKDSVADMTVWLRGKINWVNQINPEKGQKLLKEFQRAVDKQKERVTQQC